MQPRLPDAAIAKELQQLEGAIRQLDPPQKIQPEPPRKQQAPAQPPRSVATRGIFCEHCIAETADETPGDVSTLNGIGRQFRRAVPGMCVGDPHLVVDPGLVAGRAAGVVSL
jgi:hypothetical protein